MKNKHGGNGVEIFSVQMEKIRDSERAELRRRGIIDIADPAQSDIFRKQLLNTISKIAVSKSEKNYEHNFLIGLAYLEGIDVEVDRERAVELITASAKADLPEAMAKLIHMYKDGMGVSCSKEKAREWSEKLAEYYFSKYCENDAESAQVKIIKEIFNHYNDLYWKEVIKSFLLIADRKLNSEAINNLFGTILSLGICEYTLLFDSCREMVCHTVETQKILVTDLITKSVSGIYPPYGPLFWYVPEYKLYEIAVLSLGNYKSGIEAARAFALVRDVCFIFGQEYTAEKITNAIDVFGLFQKVKPFLNGVRRALCELFYTGSTSFAGSCNIYPRCFNVEEAKSFMNINCGVYGVMDTPFNDELGLYSFKSYNELDGEYIGLISCSYNIDEIEQKLSQKNCKKVRGLALYPTKNVTMEYISFNRMNIEAFYIPENITCLSDDWKTEMPLKLNVAINEQKHLYFSTFAVFPGEVKEIDRYIFNNCRSLEKVSLPDGLSAIGEGAFCKCSKLQSIEFPKSVVYISDNAFKGCKNIAYAKLPESLELIGYGAFADCSNLITIEFPDHIKYISGRAFEFCSSLTKVSVPNGIETIEFGLFENCSSLNSIELSKTVNKIGNYAFGFCENLTDINLPNEITAIGPGAFCGCSKLQTILIPSNVKTVESYTFKDCKELKSVSLPDELVEVGPEAFLGCINLTSIKLPESLREISRNAFSGCISLKKIEIFDKVEKIGVDAFKGCSNLTEMIIPEHLYDEVVAATEECPGSLKIITYNTEYTQIEGNNRKEYIGEEEYADNLTLEEFAIPEGVKFIGCYAFRGCKKLKHIILPKTLREIGEAAFYECEAITELHIPESVEEIFMNAFWKCSKLASISLPDNLEALWGGCFSDCRSLKYIDIPKNIKEISYGTFSNCVQLSEVSLSEQTEKIRSKAFYNCHSLRSVSIPACQKEIEEYTFYGCKSFTQLHLPEKLNVIKRYAFAECSSIEEITLPDCLTVIDEGAFENCSRLVRICIPESVRRIGDNAFAGCSRLENIIIHRKFEDSIQRIFGDVDTDMIEFL